MWIRGVVLALSLAAPAAAEEPLSAIDWLGPGSPALAPPRVSPAPEATPAPRPRRDEPPVARSAASPEVETAPIGAPSVSAVGLVPASVSGLPRSLWTGSRYEDLAGDVRSARPAVPALQALLNTLMLAEADPPLGGGEAGGGGQGDRDGAAFLRVRVERLVAEGAIEAAAALLERAGPERASLFPLWLEVSLLLGDAEAACKALERDPALEPDITARVFCAAREGAWPRAALAFETGRALEEIEPRNADLLERFLSPEHAEALPSLPPPRQPTPLQAALYEAVGEPIPASALGRAFAYRDLSGDRGWKAQLDAAERLVRAGALAPNRLLGIYSLREPAASGGVWDRVEALGRFEDALEDGDADQIAEALNRVWPRMREAGLLVAFAELFGPDLAGRSLPGRAGEKARRAVLLSEEYESAARSSDAGAVQGFLAAIARGEPPETVPDLPFAKPVAIAFGDAAPGERMMDMAREDRLGEAVLAAMALFESGSAGNGGEVTTALATLRALGLEETARRSALELVILSDEGALR